MVTAERACSANGRWCMRKMIPHATFCRRAVQDITICEAGEICGNPKHVVAGFSEQLDRFSGKVLISEKSHAYA
jgi:hypothetical protein